MKASDTPNATLWFYRFDYHKELIKAKIPVRETKTRYYIPRSPIAQDVCIWYNYVAKASVNTFNGWDSFSYDTFFDHEADDEYRAMLLDHFDNKIASAEALIARSKECQQLITSLNFTINGTRYTANKTMREQNTPVPTTITKEML